MDSGGMARVGGNTRGWERVGGSMYRMIRCRLRGSGWRWGSREGRERGRKEGATGGREIRGGGGA